MAVVVGLQVLPWKLDRILHVVLRRAEVLQMGWTQVANRVQLDKLPNHIALHRAEVCLEARMNGIATHVTQQDRLQACIPLPAGIC